MEIPKKILKLSKYLGSMFGLRQGEKYNSYEEVEVKFAHDAN